MIPLKDLERMLSDLIAFDTLAKSKR